jgi:putative transposase
MSRAIAVGHPHNITQRGNDRRTVFHEADDYLHYREWLARNARKFDLDIWAWCLMPNHIHVVAVPNSNEALSRTFNTVHMQYAQYHNRRQEASGHLWQGRYFSCLLDETHVYAAVRYVEMNPVRGGLAASAQDYPWSSAKSHVLGTADPLLSSNCFLTETVRDWGEYLAEAPDPAVQEELIRATVTGRPCGAETFVKKMETLLDRSFIPLPSGRPRIKKSTDEVADLFPAEQ